MPHPRLSDAASRIIAAEMDKAQGRHLEARGAQLKYILVELKAATNPALELPPHFQLALTDPEPLRQYLFSDDFAGD